MGRLPDRVALLLAVGLVAAAFLAISVVVAGGAGASTAVIVVVQLPLFVVGVLAAFWAGRRTRPRSADPTDADAGRRGRRIAATVVLVVALIVGMAANVATWTKDVALDTDEWVATVAPLPKDPAVADAIADLMVEELSSQTEDIQSQAREALPPEARPFARLARPAIEDLIREQTSRLIQTDQFQELWIEANRLAHETLTSILNEEDSRGLVESSDGVVRLDLSPVVAAVRDTLGDDAEALLGPPQEGEGVVEITTSDQLVEVRQTVDVLDTLGIALPIATWLLLAASVVLAPDRRRFLVVLGAGVAIAMAITLIALDVARAQVIGLIEDDTVRLGGGDAWDVLTANLVRQSWAILAVGVVIAAGAWISGPSSPAGVARRWARAFALSARGAVGADGLDADDRLGAAVRRHRGALQAGGCVLAVAILVVWDRPGLVTVLVVAALLVAWLIALEALAPRGARAHDAEDRS